MGNKKTTIVIELTEAEAAALDRYVEEGCYDRDKIIKRMILNLASGTGAPFQPTMRGPKTTGAPWPGARPIDSARAPRQRPYRKDHQHPIQHPIEPLIALAKGESELERCFRLANEAAERGLPDDPAIYA
jgi:hypothetical protein